jgi:hypothetical protein
MNSDATSTRPRRWRLQFSLRLLLLALTAFAIGFPIWYRWPYEESTEDRNAAGIVTRQTTTTWQRQWGGGRLKHGIQQTRQLTFGPYITTTTYVRGKRNGPYTESFAKTQFSQTGQYADDMKEGRWIAVNGKDRMVTSWHHDMLDGDCEFPAGRTYRNGVGKNVVIFAAGRMVMFNGKRVEDATFDLLPKRQIDDQTANELVKVTQIDMVEMPLSDAMMYVSEMHRIPIAFDMRSGLDSNAPVAGTYRGMDLKSALVLLTAPYGLACDYRYGSLCITKADKARDWRDTTGIEDIKPPAGSMLARVWTEPVAVDAMAVASPGAKRDALKVPLAGVLNGLAERLAISIDTALLEPTDKHAEPIKVALTIRGVALRDALGQLLYNTGCRCQLDGDTLVILPPEDAAEKKQSSHR